MSYMAEVCRICLRDDGPLENVALVDSKHAGVLKKLEVCVPEVNWKEWEDLFLCERCLKNAEALHKFRLQCCRSTKSFKSYMNKLQKEGNHPKKKGKAESVEKEELPVPPLLIKSQVLAQNFGGAAKTTPPPIVSVLPEQNKLLATAPRLIIPNSGNGSFQNVFVNLLPVNVTNSSNTATPNTSDSKNNVILPSNNTFFMIYPNQGTNAGSSQVTQVNSGDKTSARKVPTILPKSNAQQDTVQCDDNLILNESQTEELSVEVNPMDFDLSETEDSGDQRQDWEELTTSNTITSPDRNETTNEITNQDFFKSGHFLFSEETPLFTFVKCEQCSMHFDTIKSLRNHIQDAHDGKYPYNCQDCSINFAVRDDYFTHLKSHQKVINIQRPITLTELEKKDNISKELPNKKKNTPEDVQLYKCNPCHIAFRSPQGLKKHKIDVHGTSPQKKYFIKGMKNAFCKVCKRRFSTQSYLLIHLKQHLQRDECTVADVERCKKEMRNRTPKYKTKPKLQSTSNENETSLVVIKTEINPTEANVSNGTKIRNVHKKTNEKPNILKKNRFILPRNSQAINENNISEEDNKLSETSDLHNAVDVNELGNISNQEEDYKKSICNPNIQNKRKSHRRKTCLKKVSPKTKRKSVLLSKKQANDQNRQTMNETNQSISTITNSKTSKKFLRRKRLHLQIKDELKKSRRVMRRCIVKDSLSIRSSKGKQSAKRPKKKLVIEKNDSFPKESLKIKINLRDIKNNKKRKNKEIIDEKVLPEDNDSVQYSPEIHTLEPDIFIQTGSDNIEDFDLIKNPYNGENFYGFSFEGKPDIFGLTMDEGIQQPINLMDIEMVDGKPQCSFCKKLFGRRHDLKRHINNVHLKFIVYNCHVCDRKFYEGFHLTRHLRGHFSFITCGTCLKPFCAIGELKNHLRTVHNDCGDFNCGVCNETFFRLDILREHMELHDKSIIYQCHLCDHSYSECRELTKHLIEHSGMYTCLVCQKPFCSEQDLYVHDKQQHREPTQNPKRYSCEFCPNTYKKKRYLVIHQNNAHSISSKKPGAEKTRDGEESS